MYNDFDEIKEIWIEITHGKGYLKKLKEFDLESKKGLLWINSDCYFNEHSF